MQPMMLQLAMLADHPSAVPLVAKWLIDEWGYERLGGSVEALSLEIVSKLDPRALPIHVLALLDGFPAGVAILKPHEMKDIFPQRTPWVGSLVVAPEHRNRGIGAALVGSIEELALRRGFTQLYLQTERKGGGLYTRLGWQTCDELQHHGRYAHVMSKALGPPPAGTSKH
jgi:GNAT superfamily N-acetyltransferase